MEKSNKESIRVAGINIGYQLAQFVNLESKLSRFWLKRFIASHKDELEKGILLGMQKRKEEIEKYDPPQELQRVSVHRLKQSRNNEELER
tara:strand:- start:370 stop:639 length:270 start_codon:yes stop_codon:yes gene_type:complete